MRLYSVKWNNSFVCFLLPLALSCSESPVNATTDKSIRNSMDQVEEISVGTQRPIDFSNLRQYFSSDSILSFTAPVGLFQSVSGGFVSIDEDFGITFEVQSQNYPCDPDEQILNVQSMYAKSVRDINVTYKSVKKDRYVFSGFDSIGRIVYEKCVYEEFFSMQGRDEGIPSHVWSRVALIRCTYPPEKKSYYDPLVELIVNSLNVNLDRF